MPGKRYTTEQKIRILREAAGSGKTVVDVCRDHQISEQTFHRWKREFGMLEVDQIELHGAPPYIRSDNGSEFIEGNLRAWLAENKIKTIYIDPGSPWQNGYIESFNARLREECLNREQLWTLTEARVVLEDWRWKYNHVRPHRSLGYITPLAFAQKEAEESSSTAGCASSRPTPSLRHSLDLLYHLEQLIHPARLTQALGQIE